MDKETLLRHKQNLIKLRSFFNGEEVTLPRREELLGSIFTGIDTINTQLKGSDFDVDYKMINLQRWASGFMPTYRNIIGNECYMIISLTKKHDLIDVYVGDSKIGSLETTNDLKTCKKLIVDMLKEYTDVRLKELSDKYTIRQRDDVNNLLDSITV